jgi:hypothetical protein
MAMSITELERALRGLRLSGMGTTLQARALQVASHEMQSMGMQSTWGQTPGKEQYNPLARPMS